MSVSVGVQTNGMCVSRIECVWFYVCGVMCACVGVCVRVLRAQKPCKKRKQKTSECAPTQRQGKFSMFVCHIALHDGLCMERMNRRWERERAKWTRKIAKAIAKRHFLECIWLVFHQNGIVSRRATTYDRRTDRLRCYLNNFISDSRFRLRTSFVNEIKFIYLPCEYHHRIAFARINSNQPVKSIFKLNFKTFSDQKNEKK